MVTATTSITKVYRAEGGWWWENHSRPNAQRCTMWSLTVPNLSPLPQTVRSFPCSQKMIPGYPLDPGHPGYCKNYPVLAGTRALSPNNDLKNFWAITGPRVLGIVNVSQKQVTTLIRAWLPFSHNYGCSISIIFISTLSFLCSTNTRHIYRCLLGGCREFFCLP